MNEAKIPFAVVGFGHIGRKHATMVAHHPESELVGIVEIDPARQEAARSEFGVPVYDNINALFEQERKPEVVNIATPNGLHAEHAIRVLEHKAHTVIEKPMALSKANAEEIIYKALQVSRTCFLVKQNRYSPTSEWLKDLITNRVLGDVYMVQLNCYWNRDDRYYKKGGWKGTKEMDGGVLFTQFSHFIDIMYWLFGDIKNIQGRCTNFNHPSTEFEDTGVVQFDFVNGGMGSLNFSTSVWGQNMESSIAIIGQKGSVKVSGQYMDTVAHCVVDNYTMPELPPASPPNDYGDYKGSAANHHFVIQNVIDVLRGRDIITTNALEGMKVVEMIERIYKRLNP